MGGRKRVCGSKKKEEKRKGGGEGGTVPSQNDWALWISGGDVQDCFLLLLLMVYFRRAASRHREASRNGLNGSVKGKEDAPEL